MGYGLGDVSGLGRFPAPNPSLRAKRGNPVSLSLLDCHASLAMTVVFNVTPPTPNPVQAEPVEALPFFVAVEKDKVSTAIRREPAQTVGNSEITQAGIGI